MHNVTRPYIHHKKKKSHRSSVQRLVRCDWPGTMVLKAGPALSGECQDSRFDSSKPRYGPEGVPRRGSSYLSPSPDLGRSKPTVS